MSENDLTVQQEVSVINRVTVGVSRTVQLGQYQPYQVSTYMTLAQGATPEDIFDLVELREQLVETLSEAVNNHAEAMLRQHNEANGLVDNRPTNSETAQAGLAASYHERGSRPSSSQGSEPRQEAHQQPKRDRNGGWYTTEVIDGREYEVRHYYSEDGLECVSVPAVQEGERATYKPSKNPKTGIEYTALDNLRTDVKYGGGPNTWEVRMEKARQRSRGRS